MYIGIKIAVHPAVKKYIAYKHDVDPFVISRTNCFGIFLQNCIVRMHTIPKITCDQLNPEIYSEELSLGLSEDLYRRQGWYIHPKRVYDFNRMVQMMMEQDFLFWMDVNTNTLNNKIYDSFLAYREKYDFTEDDLTVKAMAKRYERHRKRLSA